LFDLTPQERRALLFFSGTLLAGSLVNVYTRSNDRGKVIFRVQDNFGKTDLNLAGYDELVGISGLGDKLVLKILEYRRLKGRFDSLEELKEIRGINGSRFQRIKNLLFVE